MQTWLPADVEQRLRTRARAEGRSVSQTAALILEAALPDPARQGAGGSVVDRVFERRAQPTT